MRIIIEKQLPIDLADLLHKANNNLKNHVANTSDAVFDFMMDRLKGYYSKYPSNLSGYIYIYIYMRTWQVATEIPRPGIQWVEHDGSNESPVADWVSHVVEYKNGAISVGVNPGERYWPNVKRWALV